MSIEAAIGVHITPDVTFWHKADVDETPINVHFRG